ncbi:MAG: hypothetical protein LBH88_01285 [Candidatus Methanoplasma sp.]|jgi:hypothetical protein|nr:hypothetical protein [Candidatus Methanoplasma sp.]
MEPAAYKISVAVPAEYKDELMDAVNDSMQQIYPGYDRTFSITMTTGTWRPLEGSDPHTGRIGEISVEEELRIDFAVKADDLKNVIRAIRKVHPYEEPAIDIMPRLLWKDVIGL